jgi:hypothetical protein
MPVVPNDVAGGGGGGLSTERRASSIPVADPAAVPQHQQGAAGAAGDAVWMYPSEQQFYNAMARKVRARCARERRQHACIPETEHSMVVKKMRHVRAGTHAAAPLLELPLPRPPPANRA